MSPPKSTPKSKRNEKSRRSSILKPRKPRQPFQNVNFDSPKRSLDETSSTPLKIKRRVSFAEKKHVKEFCHSSDQGTVWDNTYEEHDFSLKSYVGDSNDKTESTEDASLHISKNECGHICESNSNCPNNFNLTHNQLSESIASVQEKDNDNLEMTFTNSVKFIEFDEGSQCEQITLSNKSALFPASKNATLHELVCSNTDENYIDPVDERFPLEQNVMPSALPISHLSENAISSNIIIYRDSDEENNIGTKSYFESPINNVVSELDKTCNQDLSMEFTAPVPAFLLPSRAAGQINVQKDDNTNYIGNCNNVSTQASQINSDLGIFKQIAEIQNHGNANLGNNTHDKTIFSTNLQSNVASENTVFKQTDDVTQNITESMMLTNVINVQRDDNTSYIRNCSNVSIQAASAKPVNSDLRIFKQIAEMQNRENASLSVETNTYDKTIFSTNLQSNVGSENTVFKQIEDATQNITESMMLTNVINVQRDDNTSYIRNCSNVSIQAASAKPVNSDLRIFKQIAEMQNRENASLSVETNTYDKRIFSTNLQSNVASENTVFKQTEDATQNITESMMLTNVINVQRDDNTSYIRNCSNVSIQAASAKPVNSDLGIFKQIAEMQNRENANFTDKRIVSTNLQSNVASENTVFKQTEDATQNIAESMILTTVIQPSTANTDMLRTNNTVFNTSMEMTAAISSKMYDKITSHSHDEDIIEKNGLKKDQTDETEFFTDVMVDVTKPVNVLPLIVYEKDLRMDDEIIPNDDRTMYFQDISMEMSNALLKNQEEITRPIVHKSIFEECARSKEKNMDNSSGFNEKTKLLCKSMEFTEAVPVSLHRERTFNAICTAQSTSISQATSKLDLPIENSVSESTLQADAVANKTIQHVPMEITAIDSSTLHLRDATDERESSNISKDDESQHLTTDILTMNNPTANNLSESRKESYIISREISATPSSTNNADHSLNAVSKNFSSRKETFEEQPSLKKFCSSFMESRVSQENNVCLSLKPNDNYVNDIECNEYSVEDTMDDSNETDRSNFRDNLEISEHNLLRKSLENNFIELYSIKPPSFLSFDSDKEDNSCLEALYGDNLPTDDDGTVNNTHNSSNQLIKDPNKEFVLSMRNEEVDALQMIRTMINDDIRVNELKRRQITNIEDPNQESVSSTQTVKHGETNTDDCTSSHPPVIEENKIIDEEKKNIGECNFQMSRIFMDNIRVEKLNCQTTNIEDPNKECVLSTRNEEVDALQTIRTMINDDIRVNELKRRQATNIENPNQESVSSTQTVKHGETNTDDCTSSHPPVIEENKIIDEENIGERINDDAEPRNNIKEKEKSLYLDAQRLMEWCTDYHKKAELIENQSNSKEHCKENLNEARRMEQREESGKERFVAEQCVSMIEDKSLIEQDPFLSLLQKLETHSERDDCIWNVYHKNIDKKKIVFGFISNSLIIVVTFLSSNLNCSGENLIEKIRIVSRASDTSGVLIRIVHKLILEKLDEEMFMHLYKTHEDVLSMLEHVSRDVKLAMDFIFDLKRLDDLNLMEIAYNEISFLCRSKQMNIILKVRIKVKRFDKLTSNDINVNCLLGTIKETDVKSLIKNIKKDHKFLRRFMNDIKDYIDIMEGTLIAKRSPIDLQ